MAQLFKRKRYKIGAVEIDRIWASVNHEESVGLRCRVVTVKIRGGIDGG